MKTLRVAALVAAVLLICVPEGSDGCAIGPPEPVFSVTQGPADFQGEFLKGKLGVLQRTFQQRYLIAAFRMISGAPLTEQELGSMFPVPQKTRVPPDGTPGYDRWNWTRKDFGNSRPPGDPYRMAREPGLLYSYQNCYNDAYEKAANALADLETQWGRGDPRTAEWVRAQDTVFGDCTGATDIPDAPASGMDPLLAAHRRYQIAAAYLYTGQYRKASAAFDRIAGEQSSPWHGIAPYLAVRALLRAGMDGDVDAYREGKRRIDAILKDPAQADWHEPARRLLGLWKLRVEPLPRLEELGNELMRPSDRDVNQSVIDLLYLVNHRQDGAEKPWTPEELTRAESTNELGGWLLAMSEHPPADAGERSMEWWHKTHHKVWLIAALLNASEKDDAELLAAAREVAPGAPEYESAVYDSISRELARGHQDAVREWADRALSGELPLSTRNMILAARAKAAVDWTEFLRFSLRRAEPDVVLNEGWEEPAGRVRNVHGDLPPDPEPVLDAEAISDLNTRVPLSSWLNASRNELLPEAVQLDIAQAGWLRAVLLGRSDEARTLMQRVLELNPGAAEVARPFLAAKDPDAAHWAALFIVLREPALRPTLWDSDPDVLDLAEPHYRATAGDFLVEGWYYRQQPQWQPPAKRSGFLPADRFAAGEAEWKQIRAAEPWEATYLSREAVEWANKHPDDPRVPEALHRAVWASRWRDSDADTRKFSKAAFDVLHTRYPKSPWTAKTPYWF